MWVRRAALAVERVWDRVCEGVDAVWDRLLYSRPTAPPADDRRQAAAVCAVLVRHGLLPPDAAGETAHLGLDGLAVERLGDRLVWYDDHDTAGPDYAELLHLFAAATGGGWTPRDVSVTGPDVGTLTVAFTHGGTRVRFPVQQDGSAWVEPDFVDGVRDFAAAHLDGDFVALPTGDQSAAHLYLPRAAAGQVREVLGVPW